MNYQIRVQGELDQSWSEWFSGWTIYHEADGNTLLVGPVRDDGELYGILSRLRQLGLRLISVNPVMNEAE